MNRPLVWLPFDVARLEGAPDSLRYATVRPTPEEPVPAGAEEVEFYVPPYSMAPVGPGLFEQMSRLRVIQALSAGVDHIRAVVPPGVTLCNGRGIHDTSTAELTLTLILASLRGIPGFVRSQADGEWDQHPRPALADRTVLIVGYGQIGRAIEERLRPFEVDIIPVARSARQGVHGVDELPDLVPLADVIVLIVPGTAETRGLVDAAFLDRMRDGALVVNMARGSVVDTDALVAELHRERISAALDVTDPEPLPSHHPLWSAPNVLITPHVGGASSAMWPRAYHVVRDQLVRFAAGEPLANVMTGEY